ncbi:MFS transporter [Phyllosticta citribraziliensis]|uniref:MFS transporter n=1 Tax=Phyllosticta citribraziliensis TaxID=989973 RepID=A0ABR1L470_9PEZI
MLDQNNGLEPPNGGLRAWSVVLGSFLLQMSSFGYINACGIFQFYYQEILLPNKSSQQLAWITTLQVFLLFALGPPVGHLVDKYGSRPVIAPFAALGILALGLLSLCKEYYQIMLCQGFLFGLACSGTTLPAVVSVSQWFSTKRGLAVGIASSGSSFGGVFFPIMVSKLVQNRGFPAAVRWSALIVGVSLFIGVLCCASPFPSKRSQVKVQQRDSIDVESRHSSGDSIKSKRSDAESFSTAPPRTSNEATMHQLQTEDTPENQSPAKVSGLSGLRHNAFAWTAFVIGGFFCMWSLLAPFNYLPEMAVQNGMTVDLAQYTVSIANAGSMVGRIVPGKLADHIGQFNVMCMVTAGSAITLLAFWLPLSFHPSNAGIIVFAVVYGFVSGGFVSLCSPCVIALVDGRLEDLGVKFGLGCICLALGALVGLPVLGAVRDNLNGSFHGLIGVAGAVMGLGAICMCMTRVKKGGWKLTAKV